MQTTFNNIPKNKTILETPTRTEINSQRWYKFSNGNLYPSITTLINHPKPAELIQWEISMGEEEAKKEQQRCAKRGDLFHKTCELFLQNDNTYKELLRQDKLNNYLFKQCKKTLTNIQNVRYQEHILYSHDIKIAGTVDVIANFNNKFSIIDFKTSTKIKKQSEIFHYFLQCTAYALCYEEIFNQKIEDLIIIIATEKSLSPIVFQGKTDDYIIPLFKKINNFRRTFGEW